MKIHSPRQLLAVVPHMLGFCPDSSLVCIALVDEEIDVMLRMDIADALPNHSQSNESESNESSMHNAVTETDLSQSIAGVEHSILGDTLDKFRLNLAALSDPQVVTIYYTNDDLTKQSLTAVEDQLEGFDVLDVLQVTSTHWRSLMCEDPSCCPEEGHELDLEIDDSAVHFVVQGSAPFESRQHMNDSLAPIVLDEELSELQSQAFIEQLQVPCGDANFENVHHLSAILASAKQLSWDDVAYVSVRLSDFHYRDAVLRILLDDSKLRLAVRNGLCDVLRRTQSQWVAPVATTLAGCAWLDGNGALARMAVDSALESDPDYSLARLLDRALTHGVPPRVWAESLAAVSFDECVHGAA